MYDIYKSLNRRIKEDEIYDLLNSGNYKKALEIINWCHENKCITSYILALESVVLSRLGIFDKSLKLAKKLINTASTDYNIFYCIIDVFRALAKYSYLEQLCLNALNNTDDKCELLKILLNTYVRMMDFDSAQKTALKLFVKNKNMSVGVLYCLFSILKCGSNASSIQVAFKFLEKIDFSEFKPEIYFYHLMSLMLSGGDYDGIIDYFSKNDVDMTKNDNLHLLLHVYVMKRDYKSALNLLNNSNLSVNLQIYKIDLSLLTNAPFDHFDDVWLELEYIKRNVLYNFYVNYKRLPEDKNELWQKNLIELKKYNKLLKENFLEFFDKSFFLKFASQFFPIVDFSELFDENAEDSLNTKINKEKLKIARNEVDDNRILYFLDLTINELNENAVFIIIEFYLRKYYKLKDYNIIVELLSIITEMCDKINSNILYNVLISLYGHIGCTEKAHHCSSLIGLKASQYTTQFPRLLHFAFLGYSNFLKSYTKNYIEWFCSTRSSLSSTLVFTVERRPHMVRHLCYLYNTHINSGFYLYNLLVDLFSNFDINDVISKYESSIDLHDLLISENINWYYRNLTTGFDGFIMPTFHYSCLLSLPLIVLQGIQSPDIPIPDNLLQSVSHFDEHELVFPGRFYRSSSYQYDNILFKNTLVSQLKDFRLYTDSSLYKFNVDTYLSIELETNILKHLLLIIINLSERKEVKNDIAKLKFYIQKYVQYDQIITISNDLLDIIENIHDIPPSMDFDMITKCADNLNPDILVKTYKFISLLYFLPMRLISIINYFSRKLDLVYYHTPLQNKIEYLIEKLDVDMEKKRKSEELIIYELYKNIKLNLTNLKKFSDFVELK